jgi:hypothetical protein
MPSLSTEHSSAITREQHLSISNLGGTACCCVPASVADMTCAGCAALGASPAQATDDSLKGGLTTTMDDLKQLLLGTLLWSPLTFMQVGTQNLQTGEEVVTDPGHSDQAITGIQLSAGQEDVLVIIGGACKRAHDSLCTMRCPCCRSRKHMRSHSICW